MPKTSKHMVLIGTDWYCILELYGALVILMVAELRASQASCRICEVDLALFLFGPKMCIVWAMQLITDWCLLIQALWFWFFLNSVPKYDAPLIELVVKLDAGMFHLRKIQAGWRVLDEGKTGRLSFHPFSDLRVAAGQLVEVEII